MNKSLDILGLSALYHDSSITYIKNGKPRFSVQEERFSKKKFDQNFPSFSLETLKKNFDFKPEDLTAVVFYDKPILKFERIVENLIYSSPKNFNFAYSSLSLWLKNKMFIESQIRKMIKGNYKIFYVPHHISHNIIPTDRKIFKGT